MPNIHKPEATDGNKKAYQDMLAELMSLKSTDYDMFMAKLYEAVSGEFRDALHNDDPITEKTKALDAMIQYFSNREEYEKCAELKKMADSLDAEPVKKL